MQLLQTCERGHDAGFIELGFKWWSLIHCLFVRRHCYFSDGDTVERKVLVHLVCREVEVLSTRTALLCKFGKDYGIGSGPLPGLFSSFNGLSVHVGGNHSKRLPPKYESEITVHQLRIRTEN